MPKYTYEVTGVITVKLYVEQKYGIRSIEAARNFLRPDFDDAMDSLTWLKAIDSRDSITLDLTVKEVVKDDKDDWAGEC